MPRDTHRHAKHTQTHAMRRGGGRDGGPGGDGGDGDTRGGSHLAHPHAHGSPAPVGQHPGRTGEAEVELGRQNRVKTRAKRKVEEPAAGAAGRGGVGGAACAGAVARAGGGRGEREKESGKEQERGEAASSSAGLPGGKGERGAGLMDGRTDGRRAVSRRDGRHAEAPGWSRRGWAGRKKLRNRDGGDVWRRRAGGRQRRAGG